MSPRGENKVLTSWKEIAAYFGKGVRTVQRWERQFGLPISRPKKAPKGVVLASSEQLDRWLAMNWSPKPEHKPASPASDNENVLAASIRAHRQLREANRALMFDLTLAMEGLQGESQELARNMTHPVKPEPRMTEKHKRDGAPSLARRRDSR